MYKQLLGGVAVAALVALSAMSARANPLNTFSNDDTTNIDSSATATTGYGGYGGDANGGDANGGGANGGDNTATTNITPSQTGGNGGSNGAPAGGSGGTAGAGGAGGGAATATSESYNTEQEGVSNQTLTGSVSGNSVSATWGLGDGNLQSGNSSVGGFANAAGINVASASSGHQSLNQQAVSLGIVGTVNLNGTGGTGQ